MLLRQLNGRVFPAFLTVLALQYAAHKRRQYHEQNPYYYSGDPDRRDYQQPDADAHETKAKDKTDKEHRVMN